MAQYDLTYAIILIVSALGFGLDWSFEQVRRRLTFWAPERAQDRAMEA
jgi:NitT/TauT family transport system permease protein